MDSNVKAPADARAARVCVTGWDVNRPETFPGLGDFIGWAGGLERMPNGDLLLAHSAGYWHASFASPRLFAPETREKYAAAGWPAVGQHAAKPAPTAILGSRGPPLSA